MGCRLFGRRRCGPLRHAGPRWKGVSASDDRRAQLTVRDFASTAAATLAVPPVAVTLTLT
jgi:hypothetical protein